ncbi:MAG: 8-amino-7-oxononanoate synthase [Microcoleaceae cyanobacterium]
MLGPYAWIERSLETIHRADWYRSVTPIEGCPGATVWIEGQEMLNFASNDYLGLAGDQRLIQAAIAATEQFGTGTTGSRLLTGHRQLHQALETAIAHLKQTEAALVFSSGYLANLGTIAAIVGPRDLILSDQYNHSSLKNGAKLSGATVLEYAHNQTEHLREILIQNQERYRKVLIITDSVFSMDGEVCPLPELLQLATEFGCMLLVDEAHATGVFGKTGAGCVEHFGCTGQALIQVGTLSKALGSLGGYVAGSASLIDFLRNRAPTWIYTTGLTPADTAAALAAIKILQQNPQLRLHLWENIQSFQTLLATTNIPLIHAQKTQQGSELKLHAPIVCFPFQDAATAVRVSNQLKKQGIFAPAIRPPTVNTSRIRVSLMATHTVAHLEKLVEGLFRIGR